MARISAAQAAALGLSVPSAPQKPRVDYGPIVLMWCKVHGLPEPVAEYRFHPTRKWRFDFAWPYKTPSLAGCVGVSLEIDGGVWARGRHTRGKGFIADQEKMNAAIELGWAVLRCVPADVKSGAIFTTLKRFLG